MTKEHRLTFRLARAASVYITGLLFGKALVLAIQVVLGRVLGPAKYGLYALGYSVATLVQWLAALGLDQGVLRYCALYRSQREPEKVKGTIRKAMLWGSVNSVLVAGLMVASSGFIASRFFSSPEFGGVLVAFSLALPFLVWTRIFATFAQAHNDIYRMTVLQHLLQPIANCALLLAAVAAGYRLYGALAAFLLSAALNAAVGFYYLYRILPDFASPLREPGDHRPVFRYSFALMLVGLSYQAILRISNLLLGHLVGPREVGVFSAASSFALAFGFAPLVFVQPLTPVMVELYEAGRREELRRVYQTVTRWIVAAMAPLFLLICLFCNEIMQVFGNSFRGGGPVLVLLSLGWLVYYAKGPAEALFTMTGRQKLELMNVGGIAVALVASNFAVIPRYGAVGAAAVTAAGMAVWAAVEYVEVKVLYGISPWNGTTLRQLLVAAVTAGTGILAQPHISWLSLALLLAILYAVLYYAFCLHEEDRALLAADMTRFRELLQPPGTVQEHD